MDPNEIKQMDVKVDVSKDDAAAIVEKYKSLTPEQIAQIEAGVDQLVAARATGAAIAESLSNVINVAAKFLLV